MLNIKIDNERLKMEIVGNPKTIIAELSMVINNIYCRLNNSDKEIGNLFKKYLTDAANDGVLFAKDKKELQELAVKSIQKELSKEEKTEKQKDKEENKDKSNEEAFVKLLKDLLS